MEPPEPERPSTKPAPPRIAGAAADRNSKLSALLASIDADLDLELTTKPVAPSSDESGVNAFRRAKFFFPKVLEEQRRAKEAREAAAAKKSKGKETKEAKSTIHSSSSPDRPHGTDHEPKRRKVSHEHADSKTKPRHGSTSPKSSPPSSPAIGRHGRRSGGRDSRSVSPSESPSPPPRSRVDKGKGNATSHSVNAQVVYANARSSPPSTRQHPSSKSAGKDAPVVVIDSTDDSDSDDDVKAYRPLDRRTVKVNDDRHSKKDDGDDDDDVAEVIDPEFNEYILRARAAAAKAKKEAELDAVFSEDLSEGPAAATTFSSNTTTTTTTTSATTASQATTASMARSGSTITLSGDVTSVPAAPSQPETTKTPPRTTIPSSHAAPSDKQYRVFITSHLAQEVPPLLATMRMDQEMRYARNAYLHHAAKHGFHLSEEQADAVLLTWKGSKIYNFTTGLSLGIKPDAKGRFRDLNNMASSGDLGGTTGNGGGNPSAGFQSGGLHLEIWTEELYADYLQAEDRRHRRNLGEIVEEDLLSSDEEVGGGEGRDQSRGASQGVVESTPAASNTRIRLVLTSRDYEKLKITAHSDTTVETLATAFRLQRTIGPDKAVAILWDGDELEGSMTVGEAEMEDLDSVEVHIR